jgi:GNAT superfamily N-acetyltransferase
LHCITIAFLRKGKTIHLEDLVVKESMRGTGLGYALYSEIIKQGKKDQVRRVEWNVLTGILLRLIL